MARRSASNPARRYAVSTGNQSAGTLTVASPGLNPMTEAARLADAVVVLVVVAGALKIVLRG